MTLWRYLGLTGQLALILAGVAFFHVEENQGLVALAPIVGLGFAIHCLLPRERRQAFFFVLCVTGLFAILGLQSGAIVLALGLTLFSICHLPISFRLRIALLLVLAAALVAIRSQIWVLPQVTRALPILASMFMFRLVVYLYDLRHEKEAVSVWARLSYFFLLPNVSFLVFPIVDYATAKRTWFDGEEIEIYQRGMARMVRGLSHLLFYRLISYYWVPSADEVQNLPGLLLLLATSYCQLLRISGQFHLAVGILGLFGYNLPRPCNLYFLASSFTDYWRRANIYWKDFMVKIFLYPAFMRLRRFKVKQPLFVATLFVFASTWLLHGWQWFWLLGDFRLTGIDSLFWAIFGFAVAVNSLLESRRSGRRRGPETFSALSAARHSLQVVAMFGVTCLLWSLWTASTLASWVELLAQGRSTNPTQLTLVGLGVVALVAIGTLAQWGRHRWLHREGAEEGGRMRGLRWIPLTTAAWAISLPILGWSPTQVRLPEPVGTFLFSLSEDRLGRVEAKRMQAGYYDELHDLPRLSARHWFFEAKKWRDRRYASPTVKQEGLLHLVLRPSYETIYHGQIFNTNQWGQRDRDYSLEKPAGTHRTALVGPSDAMGWGVRDDEVFEVLVENRLNEPGSKRGFAAYEILNFSVTDLLPLEQLVMFEQRALRFEPDAAYFVLHQNDEGRARRNLAEWYGRGLPLPRELEERAAAAGLGPEMTQEGMERRLKTDEISPLIDWTLERFAALAREHGVLPVCLVLPRLGENVREADLAHMLEKAHGEGFVVLDLTALFETDHHGGLQATPWDIHPGADGHARIADALYDLMIAEDTRLGTRLVP